MQAKPISREAQRIFDRMARRPDGTLIQRARWGEPGAAFMPIVCEYVDDTKHGPIYSLHHFYVQNGDVCMDPDVTFIILDDRRAYPLTFEVSGVMHLVHATITDSGIDVHRPQLRQSQPDLANFCNEWLDNIEAQHDVTTTEPAEAQGVS